MRLTFEVAYRGKRGLLGGVDERAEDNQQADVRNDHQVALALGEDWRVPTIRIDSNINHATTVICGMQMESESKEAGCNEQRTYGEKWFAQRPPG